MFSDKASLHSPNRSHTHSPPPSVSQALRLIGLNWHAQCCQEILTIRGWMEGRCTRKKISQVFRVFCSAKNQNQAGTVVHGADLKSCLDLGRLGALSLSHSQCDLKLLFSFKSVYFATNAIVFLSVTENFLNDVFERGYIAESVDFKSVSIMCDVYDW